MSKERLQEHLDKFTKQTGELLDSLVALKSGKGAIAGHRTPEDATTALVAQAGHLQSCLEGTIARARLQATVDATRSQLAAREAALADLEARLRTSESVLEQALDVAKRRLEVAQKADRAPIAPDVLLSYSHRISSSFGTSAPPGWTPEDVRRPYPVDLEMKAGALALMAARVAENERKQAEQVAAEEASSAKVAEVLASAQVNYMSSSGSESE